MMGFPASLKPRENMVRGPVILFRSKVQCSTYPVLFLLHHIRSICKPACLLYLASLFSSHDEVPQVLQHSLDCKTRTFLIHNCCLTQGFRCMYHPVYIQYTSMSTSFFLQSVQQGVQRCEAGVRLVTGKGSSSHTLRGAPERLL